MESSTKQTKRPGNFSEQENHQELKLVTEDWQKIAAEFPMDLEASARETKALQRKREIRSAVDLLRLVWMYALSDWSLRLIGAWATLQGIGNLSDVAVLQRLRNSQEWLGRLIGSLLEKRCQELREMANVRLRLMDATVITRPGSQGTDWRVHLGLDLGRGCLDGIEVTDAQGGESLARFVPLGDEIWVADRGYAHAKGFGSLWGTSAGFVVRINWHNLRLEDASGQPFPLMNWLKTLSSAQEQPVWVTTPQGRFALRLLAGPLPPEKVEQARRRARKNNAKKRRQVSANSLLAAGFLLLVSNLPAPDWPLQRVFWLYRLRWQIELEIKRLKSLLSLDHLRAQDPRLAQTYLLGKLLAALLLDGLIHPIRLQQPDWFISLERPLSVWRTTDFLWQSFRQLICGPLSLAHFFHMLPALRRYFCDSPRDRPQQLAWARALLEHMFGTFSFFSC